MKFENRSAIVTGAASGIGLAIARRLASEGVRLVAADVDQERLQGVLASYDDVAQGAHLAVAGDLSRRDEAGDLIAFGIGELGHVDILINCAGGGVIRPTLQHDEETMRATVDRNLWTMIYCTVGLLPHMIERSYGRIVSVGAESVRNGLWQHAIYNAAKGGVHGLTTGLAREFAPHGITVNVVAPSLTLTPELEAGIKAMEAPEREQFEAFVEQIITTIPTGRAATVEEVAATVAFLASDEASFVTGQTLSVNGGSSML